ncbi:MAG TPA: class I adenylate-forming enzyme family protein [Acidimicrobiales bacterium]|jgi:acyl-CoA synthetase (AMP-forming)/AMP-acid ligase II|nr:class I adenylate-forming enzyme family protein [Acidimicrobiales bacterium]
MLAETAVEAARRFGDRAAFTTDEGLTLSYAEFNCMADEVAVGLAGYGVGEGDVVALVLPSVPEHFIVYVAAAKLGALTAAVNPKLVQAERSAVLRAANPKVVVTTEELAPADAVPEDQIITIEPASSADHVLVGLRRVGQAPPPLAPDLDRPIAIVFTSGTTGTPKGAVFGGRQIDFITQCDVGEEWGGGGHSMAGSALAHLGPTTKLAGNLKKGGTQHLSRQPWKASEALRMVAELKIAALGGVPTQVALMLRDPTFESTDLSSVRAVVMGGGPATPALIREARARIPAPLAVRYSCTEAGIGCGTAFTDPDEDAEVSVGRPQPGVRLSILGEDGSPLPPGEIGEVCLGSPAVMEGYWRNSSANADVFTPDGSVRTGDLGWVDDAGRLRLAGRGRERYVRGGYNVHPMEVEGVLADHPDVAAVAIISRDDPIMGEVGVAVIVPRVGSTTPELTHLREFAADRLARYKLPDDLVVLTALPLTAGEKVDRRALERLIAGP